MSLTLHRGAFLHAPELETPHAEGLADGALAVRNGRIVAFDRAEVLSERFPTATRIDHPGLIVPGFVDAHVHYPQIAMAGAHGEGLLDWLERYTFPKELAFADRRHAEGMAELLMRMLSRAGTTAGLIFGVSFEGAMDALFGALRRQGMAAATGLVWMDREGPEGLLNSAEACAEASERLLTKHCQTGPLRYAVLPRFAPSCSPAMLRRASEFMAAHPDTFMQTHLSESRGELDWVRSLFPEATDYTDVYDRFGLIDGRSSFAHAIHTSDRERRRIAEAGASVVHCPSANLFLGSGLFDDAANRAAGVNVAIGSDVGAGTSLCLLDVLRDFYGVQMLQGNPVRIAEMLHAATMGGAKAIGFDHELGSFGEGKRADFVVLAPRFDDLFAARWSEAHSMEEQFFAAAMLGGTSAIYSTTVAGRTVVHAG